MAPELGSFQSLIKLGKCLECRKSSERKIAITFRNGFHVIGDPRYHHSRDEVTSCPNGSHHDFFVMGDDISALNRVVR
jgi:hypothetical protein